LHGDRLRQRQLQDLIWLILHGQRKYFDLMKVFLKASPTNRDIHIYYSANNRVDRLHATRMNGVPGVHLHPYQYEHHDLIRELKQRGEPGQIIERAIQKGDKQ